MISDDERERRAMALFADAIDLPDAVLDAWLDEHCDGDAALKARILSLVRADRQSAGLLRTGGASGDSDLLEDVPPERAGNYRIVSLIGRGGMGAVYSGERDLGDFHHQVAIKVIKPGVLRSALIERFGRERQILARLNHPNIARLYDGGYLEDGSPYMVMELVEGDPVLDWVEANGASSDRRLDLFQDVCRAISHAHQNLIVHRDVTPNNVLVTADGLAKVIDFGIAKPNEPAAGKNAEEGGRTASLSYTPGYAAPERASGAPANTLSDVYSLGKLLADLFAGRMNDDIAAIVAKATALDPEDRYNSVDVLLEDLQRYRTGRPVDARNGGAGYVFAKYVGRNRIAVGLTSLVVASLSAGLIATTLLYQRAEAERSAADARFSQVRSLATFMMFDLYDELEKAGGNTRTISMLAEETENYLQSLAADRRASLDVKLETVVGLKRLADIMGNPKNAHIGKRAEAGTLLEKALAEAEALYAASPDNLDVARALADVAFSNATHVYVTTERYEDANALAQRSADLWARIADSPEATFEDKRQAVRSAMMVAVPLPWIGRHEEAVEILKKVRERSAALAAEYPDEIEALNLYGTINVELARALVRYEVFAGQLMEVMPYWDEAVDVRWQAYKREPDSLGPYRMLVSIYHERAASLRARGELDKALADVRSAEEIANDVLQKDPGDAWMARRLLGVQEEELRLMSALERHDAALAAAPKVLEASRAEFEADEEDAGLRREWGYTLVLVALVYKNAGDLAEACSLAQDAREIWNKVEEVSGISDLDRSDVVADLERLEADCPQGRSAGAPD